MKRKLGALEKVDADLPNLQHKIRNDPSSYQDDFVNQYSQYSSLYELFISSPTTTDDTGLVRLRDLIDFVSHVADCYPKLTPTFANDLTRLLELHHATLEAELRDKIVTSLVLLRRKDVINSTALLNTLWPLLISTPSKSLRALLFQKILADLKNSNTKSTNHKLNRSVQTTCFNLIAADLANPKNLWAVKLTREMWRRQIWSDAKAVSIMELASLSHDAKVVAAGVRFFLGGDQEREEAAEDDDSDHEGGIDMRQMKHQAGINKKSAKREKDLKAAAAKVKRKQKKKNAPTPLNFSALHLLNDPQGFAEKLFGQHLQPSQPKVKLNLEQKLLVLSLVSRLVGLHKLTLISLYSYFIKFLTPKQPSVTSFLASLAQSTHNLVPPDVLEPLVQKIANEFVSEAAAAEVASAGLNGIREVCVRQPLAMNETLLQDLVQYRKSKDKGVQMAARGLLNLYQEVGAEMLRKRDRGRKAALKLHAAKEGLTLESDTRRFGQVEEGGIEGLELLEQWKLEQGIVDDEETEAKGWENWDAESDSSESEGGWIDVASDGEEIDVYDSEDEKEKEAKKRKLASIEDEKENVATDAAATPADTASRATASLEPEAALRRSLLGTTGILTPADWVKLEELKRSAATTAALPSAKRRKLMEQAKAAAQARHADDAVTAGDIAGLAKLSHKSTREEKIAMAKGERPDENGRFGAAGNDHRSTTARRKEKKESEGKSTTNKEKARKKNFLMTLGKAKRKGKMSLVDRGKVLKQHVDRAKKGGRRAPTRHSPPSSTSRQRSAIAFTPMCLKGKSFMSCVTTERAEGLHIAVCTSASTSEATRRERRDGQTLQSYSEAHSICTRRKAPLTPHITLGLLQVCRQIHQEAALLPFTGNRFIFHSGGEMVDFMHSILILPQARAIRSVTLVAGTGGFHANRVHRVLESKVRGLENLTIFLEMQFGDHLTGPERARLTSKFRVFKSSKLSSLIIVGCNTNKWSRGGFWYPPVNRYRLPVAPIIEFEDAMKKLVIGAEDEDKDIDNARGLAGLRDRHN
ncbi:Severe Depolymerization of Actin [Elasticomyces elasticus]|nr:Severe Depolymerization of Actin [Elasticomyces elasticus]